MKSLGTFRVFFTSLVCGLLLTGCLPQEEAGTTMSDQSAQGTTTPEFDVVPDPTPSPGPSNEGQTQAPPPINNSPAYPEVDPLTVVTLNNGATFTSGTQVTIDIRYAGEASQMKLSMNENCSGGIWGQLPFQGSIQTSKTLTADQLNKKNFVSVQFKDYDFAISTCYNKSITHDDQSPMILFQKYPLESLQEGNTTQIIYDVQDAGIGLARVQCRLNTITQDCAGGRATVNVPAMAPGTYTFEVTATDKFGFESQSAVTWQVTAATRRITHDITVDEYRKWDILFIIDNSGSMEYEQRNMASRTRNFLSILQGLDWQIAITTTDPRNVSLGDGRFVPLSGLSNQYLLNSTMNATQAQTTLSNTLQRPETGSGAEQGIYVTYRAVERSLSASNPHHQNFFRNGSNFAVVLISDEDESDNTAKNDPQNLMTFINTTFNGQKNFSFNSIITRPGDTACRSTNGYSYGDRYKVLTDLTAGVLGSVCESDYAAQVTGIADKIRNMAKTFTLSCLPVAGTTINITRNGTAVTTPFTVNGMQLVFNEAIEPGDYKLVYQCLAP